MAWRHTTGSQLDTLVTLLQPTLAQEGTYGSSSSTWASAGDVWAQVVTSAASEDTRTDQVVAVQRTDVRIRYRADVAETWRVRIGTRTLRINAALMVGRGQWLDLSCTETDNA
jgi:SPP1 family predicted phage head-tail adaptor